MSRDWSEVKENYERETFKTGAYDFLLEAIAEIEQLRADNARQRELITFWACDTRKEEADQHKAEIARLREVINKIHGNNFRNLVAWREKLQKEYESEAEQLWQEKAELVEALSLIAYTSNIPDCNGTQPDHAERWLEKSKIAKDALTKLEGGEPNE